MGLMMMMMMMMMMCKRFAQFPMLCMPIYNMKLAVMQKTPVFLTTFSAHTKMTAEKRGQDEVFGRNYSNSKQFMYVYIMMIIRIKFVIKHEINY